MKSSPNPYPIALQLLGRKCLVVGGGAVAARKVKTLTEAGAKVTVIAPELDEPLTKIADFEWINRTYEAGDLDGAFLAFAATNDAKVNKRIAQEAWEAGVLVNVADQPVLCNFFVPSQVNRGDLQFTVSTGGAAPILTKKLRSQIEGLYGPEYEHYVELIGQARKKVLALRHLDQRQRASLLKEIVELPLLEMIREKNTDRAKQEIDQCISRSSA
jgi:precorrin-2 dehydrogenase